jgi:hypothetical protein
LFGNKILYKEKLFALIKLCNRIISINYLLKLFQLAKTIASYTYIIVNSSFTREYYLVEAVVLIYRTEGGGDGRYTRRDLRLPAEGVQVPSSPPLFMQN